jgi:hypothetical protein
MRFISKYGRFAVQIRPLITENFANGATRVVQNAVVASFEPFKLSPIEHEMAVAHWTFNGTMQEADEVTIYPPDYRIGVYDSLEHQALAGFGDDVREEIEAKLIENAELYDNMIVVRSLVPAPWPRYDEFRGTPQALGRKLVEDGHDLDSVLAYEREHQNRPKVIEEIERAYSNAEQGASAVEIEETVLG